MTTTVTRVPLCALDDIATGLGRAFDIGGRSVAVFRSRDGMLIGEQVVCPLHAFRYQGTSGACDQPGACAIEAYPAEVRDGTVYITVPNA
jgi:nitrite reductase (NADH) small subunit